MLEQVQPWRRYEDIVRFEARRAGPVYGLDREDVEQELRMVAVRCVERVQDNTGRSYVRQAVRYRLANLHREANAGARRPRDGRGRLARLAPVEYVGADGELVERPLLAPGPLPDERAEAIRMMRLLRGLSARDQRILYDAFVDCVRVDDVALERARKRAEAILTGAVTRVERGYQKETTMTKAKIEKPGEPPIPQCHTNGTEPVGYEYEDPANAGECRDCLQKASCLPDGLRSGLIKGIDLSVDQEVKAVHHGLLSVVVMRARIEEREALRAMGEDVPTALQHDDVGALQDQLNGLPDKVDVAAQVDEDEQEEQDASADEEPKEEEVEVEDEPETGVRAAPKAPKKTPKAKKAMAPVELKVAKAPKSEKAVARVDVVIAMAKVTKKIEKKAAKLAAKAAKPAKAKKMKSAPPKGKKAVKAAPKKPAKKLTKPVANRLGEKGSFRYPGKPRDLKNGGIKLPSGRTVAPPRELTPEEMGAAIEKVNTKLGLPFGLEPGMVLVHERRDGTNFEVKITANGFVWNGKTFGSLSGAAMACFRRQVSGLDVFNFTKNNNILVKGKGVPGGMFRRSSVEGQAAAE